MVRTCEHCGATTEDDARVMCPSCRRRLPPVVETPAPAPVPVPAPEPAPEPAAPNPYDPDGTGEPYTATPYGTPYGAPYGTPHGGQSAAPGEPGPYGGVPTGTHGIGTPYPPAPARHAIAPGGPALPQLYVERAALLRTSRATVAFRLVLVIPHLVVLYALSIAAEIVAVVAWFAALFTGAVPTGIYGFLGWVVTYATRVSAYLGLLTDRWPVFGGSDPYPVSVWLPGPSRLNRVAVFFRWLLMIPAAFMSGFALAGALVVGPILWLIVLIRGRVPRPVFNAMASVVRYQMRYYAYAGLLTAAYPAGLFGDAYDRRENEDVEGLPPEAATAGRPPVLHASARRLVTLIVVLGVLVNAGVFTLSAIQGEQAVAAQQADDRFRDAYAGLKSPDVAPCATADDQLGCLKDAMGAAETSVAGFTVALDDIDFPDAVQSELAELENDAATLVSDYRGLAAASTLAEFRQLRDQMNLDADESAFTDAARAVDAHLRDIAGNND